MVRWGLRVWGVGLGWVGLGWVGFVGLGVPWYLLYRYDGVFFAEEEYGEFKFQRLRRGWMDGWMGKERRRERERERGQEKRREEKRVWEGTLYRERTEMGECCVVGGMMVL